VALQRLAGHRTGEDTDDLCLWLESLDGCPTITSTVIATCTNPVHGDEPPTWFYIEGDAATGVARRRCLGCGLVHHVLDSEAHWNHPPMRSCGTCGQSMFELGYGLHSEGGVVTWMALGLRCVGCGTLDGLTDMAVPGLSQTDLLPHL
jgi:hypothetical protein